MQTMYDQEQAERNIKFTAKKLLIYTYTSLYFDPYIRGRSPYVFFKNLFSVHDLSVEAIKVSLLHVCEQKHSKKRFTLIKLTLIYATHRASPAQHVSMPRIARYNSTSI